ncbi:uncharacterized protein CDAR_300871 [Caerostris darwini]|uniref:Uncharacterized protein n=1 Tax=Caerostris darwini TaxID=1538125 RepID=A0AAV4WAF0_9ARAC|nr:uncharacterized protein CDAR_300871 [Caerostris darwini]
MTNELSSEDISENKFIGEKDPLLYTVKTPASDILHDSSIIILACLKIHENDFLSNSTKDYMEPEIIENEYEVMYGNVTNELLFATDLMKFVRQFNQLKYVPVIYGINTKPACLPAWDKDKSVDLAIIKMIWNAVKDDVERNYDLCYESLEMNYQKFQELTICIAQAIETGPYSNVSFLKNSVILCHLAVCAEKNGIHRAVFFVPLILCRIMFLLRRAGNFPEGIWIRLSKTAQHLKHIL